ncbi:hypothetical protein HMPREF9154_0404 [Arachnia propionica F0230a]|nr:hypothetical protein HMPREF9154_0404 [Arachnia propionica F0230a]
MDSMVWSSSDQLGWWVSRSDGNAPLLMARRDLFPSSSSPLLTNRRENRPGDCFAHGIPRFVQSGTGRDGRGTSAR